VSGEYTLPSENHRIEALVGSERAKHFIPVKSVHDTGATVTLSSDWDVSTLNPFIGIQHAINRGGQSVTLKETVIYAITSSFKILQL
jgi:predicted amidohydrolase YtcJ